MNPGDRNPARALSRLLAKPLLWLLVYAALVGYGLFALWRIPVEVLPRFDFPEISVIAHDPGATPGDMEALAARPLEGQLLTLPGLERLRSAMAQGTLEIDARFVEGSSAEADLQAVQGAIDRVRASLPRSLEPTARIMGAAIDEVADVALKLKPGMAPEQVLQIVRARVVPALKAVPGVAEVEAFGAGREALWFQPDLGRLRQFGVTAPMIAHALADQVVLRPGGVMTLGHQDVPVTLRRLPQRIGAIEDVTVPGRDGAVPLRDLGRTLRAGTPTRGLVTLDGRPALALIVFKQPGASTLPVSAAVRQTLETTQALLPPGAHWVPIYSQGHLVRLIGHDLGRNLALGAVLAVLVLFRILGGGRHVWVLAFSIPVSLLLGVAGLYAAGMSLNLMTLGALSIAVGLLADDAIIVLEAIHHRWETGEKGWAGVRAGLADIAAPDVSGTLTTVAVFLPLAFVGGLAGLFFKPFALAFALALLASLLVSLTLIPLSMGMLRQGGPSAPGATQRRIERGLGRLRAANERLFGLVSRHPRRALALCALLLLASLGAMALVSVDVLPLPNEGVLLESFTLPPGTSLADTVAAVDRITRRLGRDRDVRHVFARIGSPGHGTYTENSWAGEIQVALRPGLGAGSLDRVGRRVLAESRMDGVQLSLDTPTIERVGESLSGLPQPFVIRLFGPDIDGLRRLSEAVTLRLRRIPALSDVFNNDAYPVTQLEISPDAKALAGIGLTPSALSAQLRPLLAGERVAEVAVDDGRLALYLRLADGTHHDLAALRALPIRAPDGAWRPLSALAGVRLQAVPNLIRHIDGARALEISATPMGPLGATIRAAKAALAGLVLPPGYRITFGGLFPELEGAALALGVAGLCALALLTGILTLQFDGLLVPGLLLLQMPLAVTGGALALAVSGVGLNAMGLVAFLTLIGVSLNHGIVLLHRARRNEAAGLAPEEAMREALSVRFRPILLTTLTAILGMLPTALGWGRGAAPEQGLAVVILGGILWSALLSTNLLPALYLHWRRPGRKRDPAVPSRRNPF